MMLETTFPESPSENIIPLPKWRSSTLSEIITPLFPDSDDLEVEQIFRQNEIIRRQKENELLKDLKNAKIGEPSASFEAKHVMIENNKNDSSTSSPIVVRMRAKQPQKVIRKPVPPVIQTDDSNSSIQFKHQEVKPILLQNKRLSADFTPLYMNTNIQNRNFRKSAYEPCHRQQQHHHHIIKDILFEEPPPIIPPRTMAPPSSSTSSSIKRQRPIYPPQTSINLSTEKPLYRSMRGATMSSVSSAISEGLPRRRRVRLSEIFEPQCLPEIIIDENSQYMSIENGPSTSKQSEFLMKVQNAHREMPKAPSSGSSFFGSLFSRLSSSSQRVKQQRPKSTPGIINGSLYGYGRIPYGTKISEKPIVYYVSKAQNRSKKSIF